MERTVTSHSPRIVEYLDEKIELVLSAPAAWGGLEPLEPLILMLLMCRQYAAFGDDDERTLMRAYRKHLAESLGRGSARLVERLPPEDRMARAVEVLRRFAEAHHAERPLQEVNRPEERRASVRLLRQQSDVGKSPFSKAAGG